jgi:catechol 2,3-dioxygenase-like lactoylglutathione lyase family enzyme
MRVHISLPVSDITASIGFYQRLFGQTASKVQPDYANFRLDAPALMLALVQTTVGGDDAEGARHYGVELTDGEVLASLRSRAEGKGLPLRIEEQVTCCYAVADKFWATDPDGHQWEFWVRTADADSMGTARPPAEGEAACCAPKPAAKSGCCG